MPSSDTHWTRRQVLALLTLGGASLLFPFSGCEKRSAKSGLSLWHIWDRRSYFPMAEMLDRFAKLHPEIEVNDLSISPNHLKAKIEAAASVGALPDIFLVNSAWVPGLKRAGKLADLASLARADGLDPQRILNAFEYRRSRVGDELPSLPAVAAGGTGMLFTNEKLFASLGISPPPRANNWSEFTEVSRDCVLKANPRGSLDHIALDPFGGSGTVIHSLLMAGLNFPPVSPDGSTARLDTPESLRVARALDRYVGVVYGPFGGYRALLKWRLRFTNKGRSVSSSALACKHQLFFLASASLFACYKLIMNPVEVSVQPVPGLEHLHGGALAPTWSYCLNRESSHSAAAWTLLRFLGLEDDGAGRFSRAFGCPSPLAAADDNTYRTQVGKAWDGVRESMRLDVPCEAPVLDEQLESLVYCIPMRRMKGESLEAIYADINAQVQLFLNGSVLPQR